MTTVFKNNAIKEIIVYTLVSSLFINTGLAGVIGLHTRAGNQQGDDTSQKQKFETQKPVGPVKTVQKITQQTNTLPGKPAASNNNNNNEATNVNQYKPALPNTEKATKTNATPKTGQYIVQLSPYQFQILVRTISAEAGAEPFEGQVAVAAVLLNRMRSGKFPATISGNVFRSGEFESVSNGYIWDTNLTASSYKAALLALKGWDPTAGSLYFYNPAKTTSRWIWSRPIYTIIGNHYFAG